MKHRSKGKGQEQTTWRLAPGERNKVHTKDEAPKKNARRNPKRKIDSPRKFINHTQCMCFEKPLTQNHSAYLFLFGCGSAALCSFVAKSSSAPIPAPFGFTFIKLSYLFHFQYVKPIF